MRYKILFIVGLACCVMRCGPSKSTGNGSGGFPGKIVDFVPYSNNPVFAGTGAGTGDSNIRERGHILREGNAWHLWYTGYENGKDKYLGYATSSEGIT